MNVASQIGKNAMPAGSRTADRSSSSERAQSRRMIFALILLMVAIAVVAFRDRQYLFESEPAQSHPAVAQGVAISQAQVPEPEAQPSVLSSESVTPAQNAATTEPAASVSQKNQPKSIKQNSLTAHHASRKPAVAVQKQQSANPAAAAVTAQAAQRAHVADVTVQEPNAALYPRLDQRTKVEGSVELQALVATDGSIRDLQVLRGPAVLGSAAREAVLQWKFKPFTENGVAVETYARIKVNFTIKVVDGSPKTVASLQPEHVIILADNYQR